MIVFEEQCGAYRLETRDDDSFRVFTGNNTLLVRYNVDSSCVRFAHNPTRIAYLDEEDALVIESVHGIVLERYPHRMGPRYRATGLFVVDGPFAAVQYDPGGVVIVHSSGLRRIVLGARGAQEMRIEGTHLITSFDGVERRFRLDRRGARNSPLRALGTSRT